MNRTATIRIGSALAAAALVAASSLFPLWSMTMRAPQYRNGLRLDAYGTRMAGDLRELNILNHYIGMPPIEAPALETSLFPIGIMVLVALCLLAPVHRRLRWLAVAAVAATPLFILADLQWRLYQFGHTLDPHAPIRLKAFTPLVIGTTKMGNFVSTAVPSTGMLCLVGAAVALTSSAWLIRRAGPSAASGRTKQAAIAAAIVATFCIPAIPTAATPKKVPGTFSEKVPGTFSATLQVRIDAAVAGATIVVDGGAHRGPIVVHGPLTLIGTNGASIDGGGAGSVVTIEGDGVVLKGFEIRNSGRTVTEEAAGIKAAGSGHRIEGNTVRDVYFGIHVSGGAGTVVQDNWIAPGTRHGARPGHGISIWHTRDTRILRNRISDARDGVYLSFADGVIVDGNDVSGCRYGLHSMSSLNAAFVGNTLTANLLGAALMQSDRLVLRGNRIQRHREGSAAYGVLLKDIGDLVAEDNVIAANRVGIYAEGVPVRPGREAIVRRNVIAGNEVGFALQSNAALAATGNRIADNLTDVRALGRRLSPGARWSVDGRGNSWSQYRGYDADRDAIGDLPHRVDDAMDALVARNPLAQAFLYTPAHVALEAAARMFPLFRREPLLVDERPLMTAERGAR